MEDTPDVPNNFVTIISDFANDLKTTFPEYADLLSDISSTMSETSRNELYKYCMTVYPERFFDILYQNTDIFTEKSEVNVKFLPNVDFKMLYNSEGVTENIRKTLWKYLQIIMFTVVGGVTDKNTFGESMNMFDGIDETELQTKIGDTMSGLMDFFKNMDSNENTETGSETNSESGRDSTRTFDMPNMENMQDHLHTLFNGKIGSLAKEMAEEIAGDFTDLLGGDIENANPQDVIKKLMKNPTKVMGLMKSVTSKLDAKMKNGDISREEIMKEAGELLGKMKDSAGGAEMSEMFAKMAQTMGGMGGLGKNIRMDTNAIDRMLRTSKLKEGMNKRNVANKEAMIEKAKQAAELVRQRTEEQERLIAKYSLEQKEGGKMVFKLDGESSQERSFIHPDLLKEMEEEDTKKKIATDKPKQKKKKVKK